MTDERDALELLDALRGHLVAYLGDQQAREGIRRLARETDSAAQARPIKLQTWDKADPPDPRRWLVDDWLPGGRVTLLAGPGGIGKSRLALQLSAGIASEGCSWIETPSPDTLKLGNATEPGGSPTVYASWEDELEEFWSRLSELSGSAAPWVTPERLSRLHIAPSRDTARYGGPGPTGAGTRIPWVRPRRPGMSCAGFARRWGPDC